MKYQFRTHLPLLLIGLAVGVVAVGAVELLRPRPPEPGR